MRGIERLVAGALLVTALTGTAVLARTSVPGGGRAQTLRLQSPPRSHVVVPLPVVAVLPAAPRRVVARPPQPQLRTAVARVGPTHVSVPARPAPARSLPAATTEPTPFGRSHPRGHAWGHVKHAEPTPPPPAQSNGNGHAWGQSKHGND